MMSRSWSLWLTFAEQSLHAQTLCITSLCNDHGQWDLFIVPTTEEKTGTEKSGILLVNLLI